MDYDTLIKTVSAIMADDKIEKKGLVLTYKLEESNLIALQEHFYRKFHGEEEPIIYIDTFEVEIGGLVVRFTKKFEKV